MVIGSTIKNPEISSIVDILIMSISNPYEKTINGLDVLLKQQFIHYIDAPSLSLLIPVIDYGLRSKTNEESRKKAAQIIGTISHLIKNPADLQPY